MSASKRISSRSKARVIELLNNRYRPYRHRPAPRGLTIRKLTSWDRYERLRREFCIARIEGDKYVSIVNLVREGWDFI